MHALIAPTTLDGPEVERLGLALPNSSLTSRNAFAAAKSRFGASALMSPDPPRSLVASVTRRWCRASASGRPWSWARAGASSSRLTWVWRDSHLTNGASERGLWRRLGYLTPMRMHWKQLVSVMTGEAELSDSLCNDTSFSNFAVLADLGGVEAEQAAHTSAVTRAALELGVPPSLSS